MATGSNRDVRLGIGVDVSGEDGLKDLTADVRGVSTAAGAGAADINRLTAELTAQKTATEQLRQAEAAARAEQAAARAELNAKRDALALLRAQSTAATRSSEEFGTAERALKIAVVESRAALRDRTTAATAAAAESRASVAAERELAASLAATAAAQRAAATAAVRSAAEQSTALETLQGQLAAVRNVAALALGGSLIGSLAKDIADTADEYSNLSARIKIATGDGEGFKTAFQGVFDIAQRTGTAVESVGTLFTRLSANSKELGISNQSVLGIVEEVSQALQLSGASTSEAANSITQFSQAVAAGTLRGQDLNSVLEQAPRLARALADGLGVTVGQLKALGASGSLTSAQVVAALQGQSAALQAEFDQLPPTVGRALTNLSNSWTQYVGEADKGSGASHTAAAAIQALAANLDTAASLLFGLGKAAAAYAAVRLAESLIASATAARTVATATAAATVATEANTAATVANAAAQNAAGVAAGGFGARLASIVGAAKLFTVVGIAANFREIGTAIGEWVARMTGADDALKQLEVATKGDEAAARANAAATAALAQAKQQAADAALGLTKQSRALVAEFEGLTAKGESTADAIGKLSKSLNLSDVRGIETAGTALDALGERGKLAANQIRAALADALKGEDLARFETQARAAFDGSEQGARRLQAALDAIADESLRRAGTSVDELATGFSKAATSAINDVDALAETLNSLGATGDDASRALTSALDKATAAATTERALQAVADRAKALGVAGQLAGDQVAAALDKIARKADELRPGVNSLGEALHNFGLQTRDELQATADRLAASYQQIANSTEVSLADQIAAFGRYHDAAVAANGGVETSALAVQRRIIETKADAAGLGDALESAMRKAKTATDGAATALERYNALLRSDPSRLVGGSGLAGITNSPSAAPTGSSGGAGSRGSGGTTFTGAGQFTPPDNSGEWYLPQSALDYIARNPYITDDAVKRLWVLTPAGAARRRDAAGGSVGPFGGPAGAPAVAAPPPVSSPAPAPLPTATPSAVVRVDINVNGKTVQVPTTADAADALVRALEDAKRLAGY